MNKIPREKKESLIGTLRETVFDPAYLTYVTYNVSVLTGYLHPQFASKQDISRKLTTRFGLPKWKFLQPFTSEDVEGSYLVENCLTLQKNCFDSQCRKIPCIERYRISLFFQRLQLLLFLLMNPQDWSRRTIVDLCNSVNILEIVESLALAWNLQYRSKFTVENC